MNLDTATDEEIAKDIISSHGYGYGSQLEAIELAKRVMVRARAQANGLSPGDSGPSYGDAGLLAVDIVAKPDAYTTPMLALAKAYESQRERIADLEEDVERLRPREAFVPEDIFECEADELELSFTTQSIGGLIVTHSGLDGDYATVLTKEQTTQLTTALAKWAGLDGVEWKSIGTTCGLTGIRALLTDGKNVCEGFIEPKGSTTWTFIGQPTHWAPLPKPPKAKS